MFLVVFQGCSNLSSIVNCTIDPILNGLKIMLCLTAVSFTEPLTVAFGAPYMKCLNDTM